MRLVLKILRNDEGATALDYGLILAAITLVMSAGLGQVAITTIALWNRIATKVTLS